MIGLRKEQFSWTRAPQSYVVADDRIEIVTEPNTDLWQRTYYGFQNDNAPVLQVTTDERFFSFTVRVETEGSETLYDQAGVVVYLNSENWLKACGEYENETFQRLGCVVTNHGYSDWSSKDIPAEIKTLWFRLSRREADFCVEASRDGVHFEQMRICHLWEAADTIGFGVFACSAGQGSFRATFSEIVYGDCLWEAHG